MGTDEWPHPPEECIAVEASEDSVNLIHRYPENDEMMA